MPVQKKYAPNPKKGMHTGTSYDLPLRGQRVEKSKKKTQKKKK